MPTRLIPQAESIAALMAQPETSQVIPNQNPKWALQRKYRDFNDQSMQEKHMLKNGFVGFYGAEESVVKIGDTVKKHITRPDGQESQWRPSCRPLDPVVHVPKAFGKRALVPPGEHHHEEIDDLPRGRRRCAQPRDQLPEEAAMFQLKHTVRDAETGKRMADKVSDMDAKEPPRAPKNVPPEARRNGLGQATLGDKPYASVEVTQEYSANRNPAKPRLNLEPLQPRLPPVDRWAVKEDQRIRATDISQVRSLPNY